MIKGFFLDSNQNIPVFKIAIGKGDLTQEPYVTLDTGFTGEVKLDPQTASDLELSIDGMEAMTDVHGNTSETPVSYAYASLENELLPIKVTVSPGSQLAGIGLFTKFGYKASVDCKNRTVELERM